MYSFIKLLSKNIYMESEPNPSFIFLLVVSLVKKKEAFLLWHWDYHHLSFQVLCFSDTNLYLREQPQFKVNRHLDELEGVIGPSLVAIHLREQTVLSVQVGCIPLFNRLYRLPLFLACKTAFLPQIPIVDSSFCWCSHNQIPPQMWISLSLSPHAHTHMLVCSQMDKQTQ